MRWRYALCSFFGHGWTFLTNPSCSSLKPSPTCRILLRNTSNTKMQRMYFFVIVYVHAKMFLFVSAEEEGEYEEEAAPEEDI
jgi:hypothetical protein